MAQANQVHFHNLEAMLRKVMSAHAAVMEGIATHAEKERARRQAQYHALEARNRLDHKAIGHHVEL